MTQDPLPLNFNDNWCSNRRSSLLSYRIRWKRTLERVLELLGQEHLNPQRTYKQYPHELSGGQRGYRDCHVNHQSSLPMNQQLLWRVNQAQILDLLNDIQRNWIRYHLNHSRPWGSKAETADRVAAMYAGHLWKRSCWRAILNPKHPYTRSLQSIPRGIRKAKSYTHPRNSATITKNYQCKGVPFRQPRIPWISSGRSRRGSNTGEVGPTVQVAPCYNISIWKGRKHNERF